MGYTDSDLADLRVLVAAERDEVINLFGQALRLVGMHDVMRFRLEAHVYAPPLLKDSDVAIVFGQGIGAGFIRACRNKARSPNPYVPIVAVTTAPTVEVVRALINDGAHEVLAFPLSAGAIQHKVRRAVLAGRPFVTTAEYFGPCRRRSSGADWKGKERRQDAGAEWVAREGRDARVEAFLRKA